MPDGVSLEPSTSALTIEEPTGTMQWKQTGWVAPNPVSFEFLPSYANPSFPWGFAGDVTWTVTINSQAVCVQTMRLELYTLPCELLAFYHGVVDVHFLRAMVLNARPVSPTQTWTDYVAWAAYSNFGFQYDITHGSMKYANRYSGGPYDLRRWVRGINKSNLVNATTRLRASPGWTTTTRPHVLQQPCFCEGHRQQR